MHLPEAALQAGGFERECGLAGVGMRRQRKLPEDDPHPAAEILFELVDGIGKRRARRALQVGELLQGDRRGGVAADVRRLARVPGGARLFGGHCQRGKAFCAVKQRASGERAHADEGDKQERQVARHRAQSRAGASAFQACVRRGGEPDAARVAVLQRPWQIVSLRGQQPGTNVREPTCHTTSLNQPIMDVLSS